MRVFLIGCVAVLVVGCATTPPAAQPSGVEWGSNPEYTRATYAEAIDYLSKGRQKDAEWLIAEALEVAPDSQRLYFLSGVMYRSRFEVKQARKDFLAVYKLDKDTELGALSRAVISMDQGIAVEEGFEKLEAAYDSAPDEMLIRWLYGQEARHHARHQKGGARQYRTILKQWDIAPVMVHQTYAKLLTTDLGKPEDALEHRLLAVELEPEPWSYQGLANTYKALRRYDDADLVYGKLLETEPYNSIYWIQWGTCRFYMKEYADAALLFGQAELLNPKDVSALIFRGRCLQQMDRPAEGYALFVEALKRNPRHPQVKAYTAHALLFGYGAEPDFEAALETGRLPGRPAIDQLRELVRDADSSDNPIAPEKSGVVAPRLVVRAMAGDAEAAYSVAMMHRYGIGVLKEDEDEAMKWFALAAEHGHEIAKRELQLPQ